MEFAFLILTLLLIGLPFMLLVPAYLRGRNKINEQLAGIEPLLFEWGFQRASWFEQTRELILYKTPKNTYPVAVSLRNLPHGNDAQKLIPFLVFSVEIPLKSNIFIRSAGLESEQNVILDETYWNRVPSDTLAPLGLYTLCEPERRADLERHLLSEPAQRILAALIAQKDLFYIYGAADYEFLAIGFALPRSPEPQRVRRWFDAAVGLARILRDTSSRVQKKRRRQLIWLFLMLFLSVCILLIVPLFFFWMRGVAQ